MASPLPNRILSAHPSGTALSRLIMAKALSHGDSMAAQVIAEGWLDVPQVAATLALESKAAVSPGTTTDATFAAPLAAYGISADAIALERGVSVVGQLIPKMRRVPFRAKISAETGGGLSGAWVGEGAATPVAKSAYVSLSQDVFKAQTICALSKELLMVGNPAAEATIRETATAAMAAFIDGQFLTPTVTSSPGLRPAAVTNGAPVVMSTGTSGPTIAFDLSVMLANITTGGSALVWVMRPTTAYSIAAKLGASAAGDVPKTLFGIPVIVSVNSPQQITLLDASIVLYSDHNTVDVATTDQASLVMDSAPGAAVQGAVGAAPVHTSLWQHDLFAVRISRWIAYQVARAGGVTYMSTSY